jgi:hypothetical protein
LCSRVPPMRSVTLRRQQTIFPTHTGSPARSGRWPACGSLPQLRHPVASAQLDQLLALTRGQPSGRPVSTSSCSIQRRRHGSLIPQIHSATGRMGPSPGQARPTARGRTRATWLQASPDAFFKTILASAQVSGQAGQAPNRYTTPRDLDAGVGRDRRHDPYRLAGAMTDQLSHRSL